jgi:hypothetical protein
MEEYMVRIGNLVFVWAKNFQISKITRRQRYRKTTLEVCYNSHQDTIRLTSLGSPITLLPLFCLRKCRPCVTHHSWFGSELTMMTFITPQEKRQLDFWVGLSRLYLYFPLSFLLLILIAISGFSPLRNRLTVVSCLPAMPCHLSCLSLDSLSPLKNSKTT